MKQTCAYSLGRTLLLQKKNFEIVCKGFTGFKLVFSLRSCSPIACEERRSEQFITMVHEMNAKEGVQHLSPTRTPSLPSQRPHLQLNPSLLALVNQVVRPKREGNDKDLDTRVDVEEI